MAFVNRIQVQAAGTKVTQILDIIGHHLGVQPLNILADHIAAPGNLLFAAFADHIPVLLALIRRKQLGRLLLQLLHDIAEQPQVGILIAVDVADLLHGARHPVVAAQVIEKHEATVEIDALQDIVGNDHPHEVIQRLLLLKAVVLVADEGVAAQQVLVILPLEQYIVALLRLADGIEHIAVTLAVNGFLKDLDGQAEIDLIGRDVLADSGQVGCLDGIQKDQKAQDLIIRATLRRGQAAILLLIRRQVDFFRYPEIVHRLAVPVGHPGILHVIEIIQVGRVAADHAALQYACIAFGVKQGLFNKTGHFVHLHLYLLTIDYNT